MEVANIVREVSMESQSKKVTYQYVEPKTFDEAWNHPDPKQREFGGLQLERNLGI